MSFEEVLNLTVYQITALTTEESLPPGEMDPMKYLRILNGE